MNTEENDMPLEEYQRTLRRNAQRERRERQDTEDRETARENNTLTRRHARKSARESNQSEKWWINVARLNSQQHTANPLKLNWNRTCKHCGIKALTGERIHDQCFVCGPKGTHILPRLPPYPEEWQSFLNHRNTAALSRKLNNIFTLTALGVHDGDFMKFKSGVSAVTLAGGRTYHRILPAHEGQHAIRWFIHDPDAFFAKGEELQVPKSWIDSVLAGLRRVNPFIGKLESLRSTNDDEDELALQLEHPETVMSNEIAAIISLAPAGPPTRRKIVIRKKGETEPRFLDLLSPFVEPLHYMLLLPYGTLGWSPNRLTCKQTKFSQARWYRSRFFMNAEQMSVFSRLTGEYLVDAWSAIEEARLTYIRQNQHSDEDEYIGTGDEEPIQDIRLPSSFVHSPAWAAANISDCLALRKAFGPVTFFITFTTNPKWPEIISQLQPGQTANDRPDLIVRVYQQYLSACMKDIEKTMGPILYHIRINEFQQRGLPHSHIAVAVEHVPRTPQEIDQVLSAELPRSPGPLRDAVKRHMTHNHDPKKSYHRCGWPSKKCQYDYPKPVQTESSFNERGYFQPRRRQPEDANIVLHIAWLILKYDCHINVEYSVGVQLFQYLYKYLFKGVDEANWTVKKKLMDELVAQSGPRRNPVDQIKDYERGRYLSSIEAATCIASFHISDRKPGVKRLPIHLPGRQRGQMARKDGSESDGTLLVRYMTRPRHPRLDKMTYVDFGSQCRMVTHDLDKELHELEILENEVLGHPRMRIRFYEDGHIAVARIQMVYPRHGDIFYLRALLLHKSALDWVDLRTINGVTYATYQEAARALGLFDDCNEAIMAFEELLGFGTAPAQLRWIFALLAAEGNPVMSIWENHEQEMSADIHDRMLRVTPTPDKNLIHNELLLSLQNLLQGLGKSLAEIGLPEPFERQQEVDAERLRWGGDPTNLCSFYSSLNAEQQTVYDQIMEVSTMTRPPPLHIDGRAGRGKTYLLYPVIGALRKLDEIVLISAASAFAAKNYPGGRTAHYSTIPHNA